MTKLKHFLSRLFSTAKKEKKQKPPVLLRYTTLYQGKLTIDNRILEMVDLIGANLFILPSSIFKMTAKLLGGEGWLAFCHFSTKYILANGDLLVKYSPGRVNFYLLHELGHAIGLREEHQADEFAVVIAKMLEIDISHRNRKEK